MKLMALAAPALSGATMLATAEDNAPSKTIKVLMHAGRPRLFYGAGSLDRIRQMLAAQPDVHAALKTKGDELLRADFYPESVALIGGGQQANYITPAKQVTDMGMTLGLLYHLTGDTKYAAKLRDALLYYGNYVRWAGPELIHRDPPWHSELDTTTFSFGYSAGYDALHSFLSDIDRKTIADTMVRLSIEPTLNDWVLPGKRIHSFDSMGHNWWGVCVAGGGLCALALLGDDARAQSWIDAVDAGYKQWFEYGGSVLQNRMRTFERSGPSYEGVGYTNYGVSEYLQYRFAWQNTFPTREAPRMEPLEHLASYFLQTLYPTSDGYLTVNFEDSSPRSDSSATLLLLIACGLGTPEAARYLQIVQSHSDSTLFTLLREYPKPEAVADPPMASIYPHMGWAMVRSSWERDATMIAMKSGYTWNHAHADAGTFIVFKQGKALIIDSGTCAYSRHEYSSYYRTSQAHNVILFDGQGQPREDIGLGCKFPGRMHSLIEGPGLKYVYADATGPMARWFVRNYRHWIWSGDLILVIDDVRAHEAGNMSWLLHYEGEYTAGEPGSVRLTNGPAEALVKMLYPASTITTEIGLADHDPDKKIPYLVFRPGAPAQMQQWITAICLNPAAAPHFEVEDQPNVLSLRVTAQDSVEELYVNRRAIAGPGTECITAGGFTTDACLLHVRRPAASAQPNRYLVIDGSYVRDGNRSLMESLSKRNVCWSPGGALSVASEDQAPLQIGAERAPGQVVWNSRTVPVAYDRMRGLVSL